MRKIGAHRVFPVSQPALENAVIVLDDSGTILSIDPLEAHDPAGVEWVEGALVPGFINIHCHLELSFMKGHIPEHTGLIEFVKQVVAIRDQFTLEEQQDAITKAEEVMHRNGIVAVGDISNDTRSFFRKQQDLLRYHTFVEVFDLGPQGTTQALAGGKQTLAAVPAFSHHRATLTPHAPYSCTPELIQEVSRHNGDHGLMSIHLQENPEENRLFEQGDGAWRNLFAGWGLDDRWLQPSGQSSLATLLKHLQPANKALFIHNTFTSAADIAIAQQYLQEVTFGFCPRANLYIENRLPDYRLFKEAGVRCTIGTDSLASNHSLSIWEEMRTIHQHTDYLGFEALLEGSTLHGAQCLGFEDSLGTMETGKQPGVVALRGWTVQQPFAETIQVERLA